MNYLKTLLLTLLLCACSASQENLGSTSVALNIGDSTIENTDDDGNGDLLVAQSATLSEAMMLESLSFYVTTAAGQLRLGVYASDGPSGGPGTKLAETAEFTPSVGWNTESATAVELSAGTYWLAYFPSSNGLHFRKQPGVTSSKYYSLTYGALPSTFSTSPNTSSSRWSLYATLATIEEPGTGGAGGEAGVSGGNAGTSGSGGQSGGTGGTGGSSGCDLSGFTVGTWQAVAPPRSNMGDNGDDHRFTQGIAVDPNNPGTLYATVSGFNSSTWWTLNGGLFRTTDCGASWSQVGSFDQGINVRVNPSNSSELYFADGVRGTAMGFWYSSDAGANWIRRTLGNSSLQQFDDVYHVDVDPSDFAHLLLTFHYPGTSGDSCILESSDKGITFTARTIPSGTGAGNNAFFMLDVAHSQGSSATWLLGSQNNGWWRTTDSAANWTHVSSSPMTHGGGALYYDSTGAAYFGPLGYPNRSTDNGANWTELTAAGYAYWGAIGGDGNSLYAAHIPPGGSSSMSTSTEASPTSWSTGQSVPYGSFEFAQDTANHLVYSSLWGSGIWAVKTE